MSFQFLLLGAQAAGIGLNMYQRRKEQRYQNVGADIEIQDLGLQMQKEQLASTEEAVANMERLRETLATQRAIYASRGQKVGQGSPVAIAQGQIRAQGYDERARQLSMGFRKYELESKQRLIGLNKQARRSERRTKDFMQGLNLLNFNSMFGGALNTPGESL
ncbi:MAG TPA: hypothetical protein ACFYEC_00230 [Candidatus Brocadiaceae bacterium]